VTSTATRSKALAHVGIAFAICFCLGPPIGAYFAARPLPTSLNRWGLELNVYATPAILTLVLLLAETAFLVVFLPETRGKSVLVSAEKQKVKNTTANGNGKHQDGPPKSKRTIESRIAILKTLRKLHFFFLILFSGVEFTLTFLTFDCKLSRPAEAAMIR
jgi:MFS family permease